MRKVYALSPDTAVRDEERAVTDSLDMLPTPTVLFKVNPKFLLFRKEASSLTAYMILSLVFTYLFVDTVATMVRHTDGVWSSIIITSTVFAASALFVGWFLTLLVSVSRYLSHSGASQVRADRLLNIVGRTERLWVLLLLLSLDLLDVFLMVHFRDISEHFPAIHIAMVVCTLCAPVILYISIKSTVIQRMTFVLGVNCMLNLALCIHTHQRHSLGLVLFFSTINVFVMGEYHKQTVAAFTMTNQLHQTNQLNEKMAQEMRSNELRHIIGNVAHDLKTPLSSFLSGLDAVAIVCDGLQPTLPATQAEQVSGIQEVVSAMRKTYAHVFMILNRCLDASQALQGLPLQPRPSSVVLEQAVQGPVTCADLNDVTQIGVVFEPEGLGAIVLRTDSQWLQDNLLCLLSNAVKYSQLAGNNGPGNVLLVASVTTRREIVEEMARHPEEERRWKAADASEEPDEKMILFSVTDSGDVIRDATQLSDIFSPKPATQRHTGGTGLGLYSLARRMEVLHGLYGAKKATERGCMFWFALPCPPESMSFLFHTLEEGEEGEENDEVNGESRRIGLDGGCCLGSRSSSKGYSKGPMRRSASTEISNSSQKSSRAVLPIYAPSIYASTDVTASSVRLRSSAHPLHVMIVDDSAVILKLTSQLLHRHGHTVVAVSSGIEALELLAERIRSPEEPIDVVLLDLQMPQLSGPETAARIRALEHDHNDAIELVSGGGSEDLVRVFGASLPRHQWVRHTIVGFSAKGEREEIERSFRMGMDAFLHKPFTLQAFLQAVLEAPRPHIRPPLL